MYASALGVLRGLLQEEKHAFVSNKHISLTELQLRFGSTTRAVNWVHGISFTTLLLGAISMLWNYPWLSLALLLFTAALQNIRRPLFVTMADDVMASEYRTTGLSVESQMRSWLFAMSALGSGMLADTYGLEAAFGAMAVIVALAWTIGLRRTTA